MNDKEILCVDVEDPMHQGFDFTNLSIRRGFIKKVYAILSLQLLVTAGFIALFLFHDGSKMLVMRNPWLLLVAFGILITVIVALACFGELRRRAPMNMILLAIFTCAQAFLLAVITAHYDVDAVLMAVGITVVICVGLTLFAFQTKWDFTILGGFLFVVLLVLVLLGFVISILAATHNLASFNALYLVYASLGAILFSFYLIYDTQLMIGGQHKYAVSPEEYVFAALNLYLDVINIFLFVLRIIGYSRG